MAKGGYEETAIHSILDDEWWKGWSADFDQYDVGAPIGRCTRSYLKRLD